MKVAFGFCAAVIALMSTSSGAADLGGMPDKPRYDRGDDGAPALHWQGVYAGVNGGYDFGRDFTHETSGSPYNAVSLERFRSDAHGFTGGVQLGYNYQINHVVFGIEADMNYAGQSRKGTSFSGAVSAGGTGGYVGTVRPRLGLAFGPWLFYGTGGLAYGNPGTTITGNINNALSTSNSDWRVGWVAGIGTEYAIDQNWSVRTELLHMDFGRTTISGVGLDGNTYSWSDRLSENALRVGVNYRY